MKCKGRLEKQKQTEGMECCIPAVQVLTYSPQSVNLTQRAKEQHLHIIMKRNMQPHLLAVCRSSKQKKKLNIVSKCYHACITTVSWIQDHSEAWNNTDTMLTILQLLPPTYPWAKEASCCCTVSVAGLVWRRMMQKKSTARSAQSKRS